jgi:hypothetical protein
MSSGEFSMKITLGNDAMQTTQHVSAKLREIAERIDRGQDGGKVMDDNGNSVGSWDLSLPDEEEDDTDA